MWEKKLCKINGYASVIYEKIDLGIANTSSKIYKFFLLGRFVPEEDNAAIAVNTAEAELWLKLKDLRNGYNDLVKLNPIYSCENLQLLENSSLIPSNNP